MSRYLIFLTYVLLLAACNQVRDKTQEEALPLADVPPSYLSVRVNFPASELEKGINNVLPRTLVDGAFPMKDDEDSLFLKIRRTGNLEMQVKNNEVFAAIPLYITASAKKKVLGITVSNKDSPVTFSARVNASTQISMEDDWEMKFICSWGSLELLDDPQISIMGLKINIGGTINRVLNDYRDNLSDVICRSLRESVSLKPILEKVYTDLQNTHRIARKPKPLFLRSEPVAMSGVLIPNTDTISIHLEYRTRIHISPENRVIINKQTLTERTEPLNTSSNLVAYPELYLPYSFLEDVLNQLLRGQQYEYEKYQATIQDVKVTRSGQQLAIAIQSTGDLRGTVIVTGRPSLDDQMEFSLKDFKYKLDASSDVIKMTDMAVHSFAEEYLSKKVKINLQDYFDDLDEIIMQGLAGSPLGSKLSLGVSFGSLKSYNLVMTENGLQWILMVEGKAKINLKNGLLKNSNS